MEKETRRTQMTKRLIKDALIDLLETKPLSKISITEICKLADVNRSTYYNYYYEIAEIVNDIEDEIISKLPSILDAKIDLESNKQFVLGLENFLAYIKENKAFSTLILKNTESNFISKITKYVMHNFFHKEDNAENQITYYGYIYSLHGTIGIVIEWIKGKFPISCKELAEIVFLMSAKANAK